MSNAPIQPANTPNWIGKGTHGTSSFRAKAIQASKFIPTTGRAGLGVYFWKKTAFAERFAKDWHRDRLSEGLYGGEADQLCAVILADIVTNTDQYFDLEDPAFKEKLMTLIVEREAKGTKMDTAACVKLRTALLRRFEDHLGCKATVLQVALPPPKASGSWYLINPLGAPLCYLVIDPDCIKIETVLFTEAGSN